IDISEEYLNQEVLAHFETYRDRVVANANSNTVNRPFDLGDRVLVKRDFDSNQRTRRYLRCPRPGAVPLARYWPNNEKECSFIIMWVSPFNYFYTKNFLENSRKIFNNCVRSQ
ncbi:hypothetical protein ENBRE01_3437, partial [Enteropsectra breve]